MARLPPEFIQKLRASINIADVIGEHVTLKKSGANLSGLCPFHSERTPSFYVNEKKQLFHCYGCGAGGDLISFVKDIHGLSFMETVEELAERAKLPLPRDAISSENETPEQRARREEQQKKTQTALRLNRFAATFYRHQLAQSPHARSYFRDRGVSEEISKGFFVGLARDEWSALADHLQAGKAPMPLAAELGLIRSSTKRGSIQPYFDLFRDRAMFPIIDPRGRVVGFGGRKLSDKNEGPKYLNSSESLLFQKNRLLYGLFQAQRSIREKGEALVTEGYFDVLTMHAFGFQNAVATCGTALSADHLKTLSRLASKITVVFDNDRAGQEATLRAMELGLELGLTLHSITLPEGMDPDEACLSPKHGPTFVQALLESSQPIIDQKLEEAYLEAQSGSEARTRALKRVAEWLSRFSDPVGREVRLQWVSDRFQMPRASVEAWIGKGVSIAKVEPARTISNPKAGAGKPQHPVAFSKSEKILVTALVRLRDFPDLVSQIRDSIPEKSRIHDLFVYPSARAFVENFLQKPGAYDLLHQAPEWVTEGVDDPVLLQTLSGALVAQDSLYTSEEVRVALGQLLYRFWARISHQLKARLELAESNKDKDLEAELLKDYLDVQKKLKEFDKFYGQSD